MKRQIVAGIDIGTYQVKAIIAEKSSKPSQPPRILGKGVAESKGLRHGYIMSVDDVARSIHAAVLQAEKQAKVDIREAYLAMGGVGLSSITTEGTTTITRADQEITDLDLEKIEELCEQAIPSSVSVNRKVLHQIPLEYQIDSKPVLGNPLGMKAEKLSAKYLFVTCIEKHLNDIIAAMEIAGLDVTDVIASPIAASFVTLNKSQKVAGCVLANLGAETLSIVVYENNIPISLEVFPIGSTDITNDIALGFRIPLEEAETLKHAQNSTSVYSRKRLEEIIEARLVDMFELIENHLKTLKKDRLLPAGIIITGGGSHITSIEELAKSSLNLPSRIAELSSQKNTEAQIQDSFWSVAYGLCVVGSTNEALGGSRSKNLFVSVTRSITDFIKQLLP